MAFTYVDSLATDRDRVRFAIQDTTSGGGPKPADANFSDAEISGLITNEGSWQRAVAGAFEALEAAWRRYPNFSTTGLSVNRTAIADGYATKAATWRRTYGAPSTARAGSRSVTRQDGYSSDLDNVTA